LAEVYTVNLQVNSRNLSNSAQNAIADYPGRQAGIYTATQFTAYQDSAGKRAAVTRFLVRKKPLHRLGSFKHQSELSWICLAQLGLEYLWEAGQLTGITA
jgi:hypothetical protein